MKFSLTEAINKGMLVPFRYYGIYDETDYSGIHPVHGHYEEKDLNGIYIWKCTSYDLIYKYYKKNMAQREHLDFAVLEYAEGNGKGFLKEESQLLQFTVMQMESIPEDRSTAIEKLEIRRN